MKMRRLIRPRSASTRPAMSVIRLLPDNRRSGTLPRHPTPRNSQSGDADHNEALSACDPLQSRSIVIPAKAGTQGTRGSAPALGPRFRGGDGDYEFCALLGPAVGGHQLCPASIEAALDDFAVAVIAGPS